MRTTRRMGRAAAAICGLALASGCGDDAEERGDARDDGDATTVDAAADATEPTADEVEFDAVTTDAVTTDIASDAADGDVGPHNVSFEDFCDGAAAARWHTYTACFGAASYPRDSPEIAAQAAGCRRLREAVDAGRLVFDGARAATCLEAASRDDCVGGFETLRRPACAGVLEGGVGQGGACYPDVAALGLLGVSECATGACYDDGLVCPATCHAWPEPAEPCSPVGCGPGAACTSDGCHPLRAVGDGCDDEHPCVDGAACVGDAARTCVAVATFDTPCSAELPCAKPFACIDGRCAYHKREGDGCDGDPECPAGTVCGRTGGPVGKATCHAPVGVGSPCTRTRECAAGLFCDLVCEEVLALGDACATSPQCGDAAWCAPLPSGAACVARAGAGTSCAVDGLRATDPLACRDGLLCMHDGRCHPVGEVSDPCASRAEVAQATCRDGLRCDGVSATCAAPSELGGPCDPRAPRDCAPGLACRCTADEPTCSALDTSTATFACGRPTPPGQACWIDAECESATCGERPGPTAPGRCAPLPVPCAVEGDGPTSGVLPDGLGLSRAEWVAGARTGAATGTLTFDGVAVDYRVATPTGDVTHEARGFLTTEGAATLEASMSALAGQWLEATYGCPNCTDGGATTLTLDLGGETFATTYDRTAGPPPILGALDALVEELEAALQTCTTSMLVVIQGSCPVSE